MTAPSAIASLVRWPNALIAATGVAVGAWWTGGRLDDVHVISAVVAALALSAFAYAANDIHDIGIDRVAHPGRPLPRGLVSVRAAWLVAIAAALVALAAATLASRSLGLITLAVLAAMHFYSGSFKRHGLPGNLLVAVIASLPFLYGGLAVGAATPALALVALAVPLHLAREIAKDLDDVDGDAAERSTLPVAHGVTVARVALVLALLAFGAMLLPWMMRRPLFALLIAPALLVAGLGALRAIRGLPGGPARFKAAMLLAMGSLIALRTL